MTSCRQTPAVIGPRCRLGLACLLLSLLAACGGGGGDAPTPVTPPAPPPAPAIAPSISAPAQDARVVDGGSATFSISATGTAPLSYQWQRDGSNIAGATLPSYTTPALRLTDSGSKYQVQVSGPGGNVSSTAVTLTVTAIALSIARQPLAQTAPDGGVVSLVVQASGSEPISYQWLRDGVAIAGATEASYTSAALSLKDSKAQFQVQISNPAGMLNSDAAALVVTPVAAGIGKAPESLTSADGASIKLSVTATGSPPFSYQWKRNGVAIANAIGSDYEFKADFLQHGDRYSVLVSNIAGTAESTAAVISVNPQAATFASQPQAATISTGGGATFSVSAGGTAPLSYQWQRSMDNGNSWTPIAGATSDKISLGNASLADAFARFRVAVTNPAATVYSEAALLTVNANLRLLAGGLGGRGYAEGRGDKARFDTPGATVADASGNLYVADSANYVIRRISPDGQTSVFAGKPRSGNTVDGSAAVARLGYVTHLSIDGSGNLYAAENCVIRKITPDAAVTTLAGSIFNCKPKDGQGSAAGFSYISGLIADATGTLYVSDGNESQTVRKVTADGAVSTVAGSFGQLGSVDGAGTAARFKTLGGLTLDSAGNLFVIDDSSVRRIGRDGTVSRYAGQPGSAGTTEGDRLTAARLNYPTSLGFDLSGNLFLTEYNRIVRIGAANGLVLTAAGQPYYYFDGTQALSVDGVGSAARIYTSAGMSRMPSGNMAFAQWAGHSIRLLTPGGSVSTLAGLTQATGKQDGLGSMARFNQPENLLAEPGGTLIVADYANSLLRRIASDGTTTTVAGSGSWGFQDGVRTAASFSTPTAAVRDMAGNIYVTDSANHLIRKITPTGLVSTLAGKANEWGSVDGTGSAARFNFPRGIAIDSKGNLYVADANSRLIRRISSAGSVSTLAGQVDNTGMPQDGQGLQARFGYLAGLVMDAQDNLYVVDQGSHAIRRITPDGLVSTIAGGLNSPGHSDDVGPFARFNGPTGLALDGSGNLYVADTQNDAIRRITPGGMVSTVIGIPGVGVLRPERGGSINKPTGVAVLPNGRLIFVSEQAVVTD